MRRAKISRAKTKYDGLSKDFVCTLKLQHIKRIKDLDIWNASIEMLRGIRIAWNRNWIESEGRYDD